MNEAYIDNPIRRKDAMPGEVGDQFSPGQFLIIEKAAHQRIARDVCAHIRQGTTIRRMSFELPDMFRHPETTRICRKTRSRNRRIADKTRVYAHRDGSDTRHDASFRQHENAEEIVSRHIKLLHRYNEAKDATQVWSGSFCTRAPY
ncbi:hypothetical protein JVT61DRAFT_5048 [Boletus reticuloceps]|uniref:Uncharacterized protein n=1 Tax=Boletus reticuloceps TaxID=495285 RepID=A0A8I3AFN9_9AGAM|nr:hypothetical protein JVT61DRAFT_5048 [Boletus reticuloceps]